MDHLNKGHRVQHLCAASPEEGRTSKCVGLLFFIPTKQSNFSDFKSTFWSMLLFCMWWCGILFGAGYFFEARLDSVVRTTFWAGQEYFLPRLNPYPNPRW